MADDGISADPNLKMVAVALVAVSVMIAFTGFAAMVMLEKLNADGKEYTRSWEYVTSGTRTVGASSYGFEGEGESKYASETEGYRTYVFTFRQTDQAGTFTVKASLICDADGTPTDLYAYDGEHDGITYWTYGESGTDYRYGIRDERVVSLDITSAEMTLNAAMVQ